MRYYEIASGFRVIINHDEQKIIDDAIQNNGVIVGLNDERKKQIVHNMIGKGLITLIKIDGKPRLIVNSIDNIWRDVDGR